MKLRRSLVAIAIVFAALIAAGCDDTETVYVPEPDYTPPGIPRGVSSITGDEQVTIVWLGSSEEDLRAYLVYRDDDGDEIYDRIATLNVNDFVDQWSYVDHDVANGNTYLYAVSAIDYEDNESDLSYEDVFDTPRPAGTNVQVNAFDEPSGFDFSAGARVSSGSSTADVFFSFDDALQTLFIEATNIDVDLQDFGFTNALDDVDWSPEDGWTNVGWSEIILGHSYIVWTADNHYAKLRVTQVSGSTLRFDWAYQIDPGNPELKRAVPNRAHAGRP